MPKHDDSHSLLRLMSSEQIGEEGEGDIHLFHSICHISYIRV